MDMSFFQTPAAPGVFAYLQAKAKRYSEVGPETYREGDFFDMPPEEWGQEQLARLESGMQQIVDGHGTTKERPITGLGISGFYELMAVLHFELDSQMLMDAGGPTEYLDLMRMRHRVDGRIVELYNLVVKPETDTRI